MDTQFLEQPADPPDFCAQLRAARLHFTRDPRGEDNTTDNDIVLKSLFAHLSFAALPETKSSGARQRIVDTGKHVEPPTFITPSVPPS